MLFGLTVYNQSYPVEYLITSVLSINFHFLWIFFHSSSVRFTLRWFSLVVLHPHPPKIWMLLHCHIHWKTVPAVSLHFVHTVCLTICLCFYYVYLVPLKLHISTLPQASFYSPSEISACKLPFKFLSCYMNFQIY